MTDAIKIIEYDSVGSTNSEAKEYALRSDDRATVLFIANEQSAGRGRLGRSFLSRRGQGIYMSLLYFTKENVQDAISVTSAAAVVVARAIEAATGKPMRIKWVNDIYDGCGKVAGILAESVSLGDVTAMVVGVGINVGKADFPEELSSVASSIGEMGEGEKRKLALAIAEGILSHAESCHDRSFMDEYRKRSMLDGEYVELFRAGESVGCGRVLGIDDGGGLIILLDGEIAPKVIRTGEVSARKK